MIDTQQEQRQQKDDAYSDTFHAASLASRSPARVVQTEGDYLVRAESWPALFRFTTSFLFGRAFIGGKDLNTIALVA